MNPEPNDLKALAELMAAATEGPDPYTGRVPIPPGVGPGTVKGKQEWSELVESLKYRAPLVRNMAVGPLVVSTIVCPKCGELFAFGREFHNRSHDNAYTACLGPDENPLCPRCYYATAWPQLGDLAEKVIAAMVECRWRYDEHLDAMEVASQKSQKQMREAFLKAQDAFWLYGPIMLSALEYVFGDQLKRAVAAIEGGASGVEEQGEGGPEAESRGAGRAEGNGAGAHPGAAAGSAPARPAEPGPAEGAGPGSPARAG